MKPAKRAKSVYISYDGQTPKGVDPKWLIRFTEALAGRGFKVHTPWEDMRPGVNWAEHVADALHAADAMVVLLSANSVKAPWVKREVDFALVNERFAHRLIPVILPGANAEQLPWILKEMQVLKAANPESTAERVADALNADATKRGHSAA